MLHIPALRSYPDRLPSNSGIPKKPVIRKYKPQSGIPVSQCVSSGKDDPERSIRFLNGIPEFVHIRKRPELAGIPRNARLPELRIYPHVKAYININTSSNSGIGWNSGKCMNSVFITMLSFT
ncbi:unnamed protein product [Adineta ricciae]|uniref:Uncharacterized protein n=1 Tax=Adineta ricciae TaxID=249248 RepID=A0A816BSE1_ADIRI|nr:unnamed protein product [Adineta ricciae]